MAIRKRLISKLAIEEVSLVPRGANKERWLILKGQSPATKEEVESVFRECIQELASVNEMLKPMPEPPRPRRRDTYEDWSSRCDLYEGSRQAARMNAYAESAYQAERRRKGYRTF